VSVPPDSELLRLFDADERYAATMPGLRREETESIVRHLDLRGHSGVVLYSRLVRETADAVIRAQVEYFGAVRQDFEWKAYRHDQPADLVERLAAHGFSIEQPEAVMVMDLEQVDIVATGAVSVRRVTSATELQDVASVKSRVYGDGAADVLDQLTYELDHAPDYLSVYLAFVDDAPAATAWIRFPTDSAFASLWGGSTLPSLRNRGLYSALLWARIDEARRRGYRYVTVDAGPMSRPILEKRGFRTLTFATACIWHG
jgi:GNAT superfamily N-acetyltransferase